MLLCNKKEMVDFLKYHSFARHSQIFDSPLFWARAQEHNAQNSMHAKYTCYHTTNDICLLLL
jgi:hypothetical protein